MEDKAAAAGVAVPLMVGLRGTQGIQLSYGPPQNQPVEFFHSLKVDSRFMTFSPQGRYLVYHTPTGVQLTDIVNKETLDLGPGTVLVRDAAFSPQEGYLVLWDAPSKKEDNSCTVYDLKSRTVKALYSQAETTWKVRWSYDEHLLFLMGKDQTYVFDEPDFSAPVSTPKARIGEISISPVSQPAYHVIVFNPCRGTPGFVRLYKWPNIDDQATALAARCVMKEDQVVFKWNSTGTHVLFLATVDMDERSYYGSSSLFLMNTKSDSLVIGLDQEGPVHSWEWNPKGENFAVTYGFMPGKTCIFNKKGDLVHTFGTQYRNGLLYNPFGNLLVLYGHGNIRGAYEVWDLGAMKKISSQDAEYMTYIEWSPDGAVLLMGTTSPRLKVGNKHIFWHYTGKLLHDQPYDGELFQISWRPAPPGTYKAPDPSSDLGKNYVPVEVKKASAYVPPGMRNRVGPVGFAPIAGASVHIHAQTAPLSSSPGGSHHDKSKPRKKNPEGGLANSNSHSNNNSTNSASKGLNQARRNSNKTPENGRPPGPGGNGIADRKSGEKAQPHKSKSEGGRPASPEHGSENENEHMLSSGDPERDKKILKLNKKLAEIAALQKEQQAGKVLEKNQLEKIKRLNSVVKELENLELSVLIKKK
ncbi:Eukaryotic translation initiation factor 2A [Hypsibius exemplaris]|uniref:Eukaryotic translation initiation factor 2A n=1 Tax=Hypsibius exemplaris TaxID=2072580 RepID=A0A9X6NGL1_HYPEX|nr:Eukaryotic translation initiation factor 2A [Hypsibius exemplaris]